MKPLSKPRILVVEDDIIGALALQNDLQELGYEVPLVAAVSEDIPALVARWHPSVIAASLPKSGSNLEAQLMVLGESHPLVLFAGADDIDRISKEGRFGSAAYLARPYSAGQLEGIIEISVARQRMMSALGAMRNWFEQGALHADQGLVVTDPSGRLLLLNPQARALTGLNDSDIAGKSLEEVFALMDERTGSPFIDPIVDAVRSGRVKKLPPDARLSLRRGVMSFVASIIAPLGEPGVQPVGAVLAFHREGEEPPPVGADAERLNLLSLAGLLGAIAHDFNNSMAILAAHPDLLKQYAKGPGEFFAPLESIQTSIQQAYLLTGQAIAIGKLGATSFGEVDLRKTTNNLLQFSRLPQGSELEVDLPPGLWKVRGDEVQIIQAIHNLLVRGREALRKTGQLIIRFTNIPPGYHELPPTLRTSQPGTAYVRMVVADSGEPIPESEAEHLFEPEIARRYGPAGVGLIATRTIVENHGGWISAKSQQGVGTAISVYWPALPDRISTPERFEHTSPATAMRTNPPITVIPPARTTSTGSKLPAAAIRPAVKVPQSIGNGAASKPSGHPRVLIIDDEELVRNSVAGMFKVLGFEADTAWDGAEGIAKFQRAFELGNPYSLVLADLVVPLGMGAQLAVKELLKIDPKVQVVVTSGYSDHPVVMNFRNHGFVGFIKKPFGLREIKSMLQSLDAPAPAN
jgi:signal transduction histidine kinase